MASGCRIVGLAAILGLLGSGVTGIALADVQSASTAVRHPSIGPLGLSGAPPQDSAAVMGLRLLQQAAAACQGTSYGGEQVVLWWGQGETSASVVEVWHQPGSMTLVRASGPASGDTATAAPSRSGPAGEQDPDEILGVSGRLLALLQANYEVMYAGRGSAAGRPALVVEVRRPGGGLAARFWIDAATKLPLRREMFDTNARMISEDAFTTLEFGTRGLNGMPASAAAPWTAQLDRAGLAALRGRGWPLPGQLPGNLVLLAASETSARPGPVINLSYSDGLAVVSLFVQRGELGRPMPGWRQITVGGRTVYSVDPAQRSFAWSADGFVYTVIADAPMATVGRVVTTLPGTSQPGFWTRMARGFRRLASWLNPLR
jgi:sigma-E factor negative regulatory protein RseB